MTVTDQSERTAKLARYLATARWYAGKGRDVEIHSVRRLTMPGAGDPEVRVFLVEVTAPDGEGHDHYQVPLSYYPEPREDLAHALVGSWTDEQLGEVHAYDAVHDHAAMALWLNGFADRSAGDRESVRFTVVGEPDLEVGARSTLLSGEQSNSSVIFGESAMMKLFRRVTPGVNPDVEILAETSLSFIGIGLKPPVVSWGVLLQEAQNVRSVASAPWLFLPGFAIVAAVLSMNFLGDGLIDAADPYGN